MGVLPGIWAPPSPPCTFQSQNIEPAVIHFSVPIGTSNKIFWENVPLAGDNWMSGFTPH